MSEEEERIANFDAFIKNPPDPGANFPNFCEGIKDSYEKIGESPKLSPLNYSSSNKADLQKYKLRIISVSRRSTSEIQTIITDAKKAKIKNILIYIDNSKTFEIYDLRVTGSLIQKRCESFVRGDLSEYYRALRRLFSLSFDDELKFCNNNNGKGFKGIRGFRFEVLASSKLLIHNKKRKIYPDPYSICNTTRTGHEEYDLTKDKKLLDFLTGYHSQLTSDHIISQEYAYNHGGEYWPISKMIEFEYSLDNQVIINGDTNSRKSNGGPSEWLPILEKGNYSSRNYEQLILSQPDSVIKIIEDYCFTWGEVSKHFGIQLEAVDQDIIDCAKKTAIDKRSRTPQLINPHYYRGGRRLVWPY